MLEGTWYQKSGAASPDFDPHQHKHSDSTSGVMELQALVEGGWLCLGVVGVVCVGGLEVPQPLSRGPLAVELPGIWSLHRP